mmetsp:Transcript_9111/g.27566  ORF Transcript_9111/g.27566 Transcript_9111/m.27566 type:complete len:1208 (-) Transcript_9111:54-3677(-)
MAARCPFLSLKPPVLIRSSWPFFNNTSGDIGFIDVDSQTVLSSGFTLSTTTCTAFCEAKTSCGECSLDPECGWCEATSSCTTAVSGAVCSSGLNTGDSCCSECSVHSTCLACGAEPGCAFDHAEGRCISAIATSVGDAPAFCTAENTSEFVTIAIDTTCAVCPGAVMNGSKVATFCSGHGSCNWDDKTCSCDSGFAGPDCSIECAGGAANPCNGNGVCSNTTGQCFCSCDSVTNRLFAGAACNETGCPCDNGGVNTAQVCVAGACDTICGARLADNTCAGSFANDVCTCAAGFWGDNCTLPCPGINATTGSGQVCGGRGICSPVDGTCTCDACHSVVGDTCVEDANITCQNFGAPGCVQFPAVNGTFQKGCNCVGQWGGLDCSVCTCPVGVTCNSISGACDFTVCDATQFALFPGNLTADTVCANLTSCNSSEFEFQAPTLITDRVCSPISAPCDFPAFYQSTAPTEISDRICNVTSICGLSTDSFQTAEATNTSDAICDPLTVCTLSQYQSLAPTLTVDRACDLLTVCGAEQFIRVASTFTTDRNCSNLTVCNFTFQFQSVAPTVNSDRTCGNISGPCDPNRTLDLVEIAAPTLSSDRRCARADDCVGVVCQNGGSCSDGIHSASCICASTHVGSSCEFFDACLVSPCQNGGICSTSDTGDAVCTCPIASADACCDTSETGAPSSGVCINSTTAESQFNNNGSGGSSGGDNAVATTAVIGVIVAFVVLLALIALLATRERSKREQSELPIKAGGGNLNPLFARPDHHGGPTDAALLKGKGVAPKGEGAEYDVCNHAARSQEYALSKGAGRGSEYDIVKGGGAAEGGAVYDAANGPGGNEAVYDNGNMQAGSVDVAYDAAASGPTSVAVYDTATRAERAEAVYDTATRAERAEAVYDTGNSSIDAPVYDEGNSPPEAIYEQGDNNDIYPAAQKGRREDVYDNMQKGVDSDVYGLRDEGAIYGCAHGDENDTEDVYGLAVEEDGTKEDVSGSEAIYGLERPPSTGEDEYANAADVGVTGKGDQVYGLRADVMDEGDGVYANRENFAEPSMSRRGSSISVQNDDFLGAEAAALLVSTTLDEGKDDKSTMLSARSDLSKITNPDIVASEGVGDMAFPSFKSTADGGVPIAIALEADDAVGDESQASGYLSLSSHDTLTNRTKSYDDALSVGSVEDTDKELGLNELSLTEDQSSIRFKSVRRANPAFNAGE